jgi:formate-dependent nitrite reductase cytochrome c552 subunit
VSSTAPSEAKTLRRRVLTLYIAVGLVSALALALVIALAVNISQRKQEAKNPFFRVVELTDDTVDPEVWGKNFPLQYDGYKRTVDQVRTRYGGSEAVPHTPTQADPRSVVAQSRLEEDPRLKTMWALNINRACQPCHHFSEAELRARAEAIQERTFHLRNQAMDALVGLIHDVKAARTAGQPDAELAPVQALQRRAQFMLDFIEAENSMGFHAPQEAARILAESVNLSRQAQILLRDPKFQPQLPGQP